VFITGAVEAPLQCQLTQYKAATNKNQGRLLLFLEYYVAKLLSVGADKVCQVNLNALSTTTRVLRIRESRIDPSLSHVTLSQECNDNSFIRGIYVL
jgi:hypothetical protein